MTVDSYKFLPRSFRAGYEATPMQAETPVWSAMKRPVEQSSIALLTSAGLYLKDSQPPFDVERERQNPLWGDPTYRVIPKNVRQEEIAATHLHLNTRDFYVDLNVVLPVSRLRELEAEGRVGRAAEEHYSFMGFQARGAEEWRTKDGPEVARRLLDAEVDALVLSPA